MAWQEGELMLLHGSDRFHLCGAAGRKELHCGDPLELKIEGAWRRGRVELSDRLGWYWTDNREHARLLQGNEARVWDSWRWPPREQERSGRDR